MISSCYLNLQPLTFHKGFGGFWCFFRGVGGGGWKVWDGQVYKVYHLQELNEPDLNARILYLFQDLLGGVCPTAVGKQLRKVKGRVTFSKELGYHAPVDQISNQWHQKTFYYYYIFLVNRLREPIALCFIYLLFIYYLFITHPAAHIVLIPEWAKKAKIKSSVLEVGGNPNREKTPIHEQGFKSRLQRVCSDSELS